MEGGGRKAEGRLERPPLLLSHAAQTGAEEARDAEMKTDNPTPIPRKAATGAGQGL